MKLPVDHKGVQIVFIAYVNVTAAIAMATVTTATIATGNRVRKSNVFNAKNK